MTQDLPDGMSEEEHAQREFFVGLLKTEVFKQVLDPNFDENAREGCLRAMGQM